MLSEITLAKYAMYYEGSLGYELEEDKLNRSRQGMKPLDYHRLPRMDLDDYFSDKNKHAQLPWEDTWGMTVSSGSVTLQKDSQNLIGISIGGGAPLCPCLYVVQVFDNTPAAKDAQLASGDEIVGVNGLSVKGKTKVEVAKMIQAIKGPDVPLLSSLEVEGEKPSEESLAKGEVTIHFNKLHADPKQGKTLDIVLKKVKHRFVENMNSNTADALGLSRAILCNDGLVKKLEELEKTAEMYCGLIEHAKKLLKATFELSQSYKAFGDVFAAIGVREPQPRASEAFSKFGEAHRDMEKFAIKMVRTVKPMICDLHTFLNKAVPDTRLTIKKYLDAKFEYLSYCLKLKEMDDEEYSYAALQEPLYRVETGNYEYRLILRCRQEARTRFAKMRSDVLVKMELLDQKHVQDIVFQLQRFVSAMSKYHNDCHTVMKEAVVFPIEVDLSRGTFTYDQSDQFNDEEEEEEIEEGEEATGEVIGGDAPAAPTSGGLIDLMSTD